jgi:hypothetical protein
MTRPHRICPDRSDPGSSQATLLEQAEHQDAGKDTPPIEFLRTTSASVHWYDP